MAQRGAVGARTAARPRGRSRPRRRPRRGIAPPARAPRPPPSRRPAPAARSRPRRRRWRRPARRASRRSRRRAAASRRYTSRPPRRSRQRSRTARIRSTASPMPERPNTIASASSSARIVGEIDVDPCAAAAPGRTGSSPAAARRARPPSPTREPHVDLGSRPERAIDLLGRRGGDDDARARVRRRCRRRSRSPPAMPPAVLTITASSSPARCVGKAHPQRAVLVHARRRLTPSRALTVSATPARRAIGGEVDAAVDMAGHRARARFVDSADRAQMRQRRLQRGFVHVLARGRNTRSRRGP